MALCMKASLGLEATLAIGHLLGIRTFSSRLKPRAGDGREPRGKTAFLI
jgi:hypothetical protein